MRKLGTCLVTVIEDSAFRPLSAEVIVGEGDISTLPSSDFEFNLQGGIELTIPE